MITLDANTVVLEVLAVASNRTMETSGPHCILADVYLDYLKVQAEVDHGEGVCYLCHDHAYLVDGVCDECWRLWSSAGEEYTENFARAGLDEDDPRYQDPFQRPGWNGDPNEY